MAVFYTFAGDHPVLTLLLAWILSHAFVTPFRLGFRSLNIAKHGWPPEYLDADGDRTGPDR